MTGKMRKSILSVLAALVVLFGGYYISDGSQRVEITDISGDFEAHFIDVGQGDAILLTAGGETAIVDAGTPECGDELVKYLAEMKIGRPKYVIASHIHADHIGSMAQVIDEFGCDSFIMPESTTTTRSFENLLTAVKNSGAAAKYASVGDEFMLGDAKISVISPKAGVEAEDLNDTSIVLRVEYGGYAFLLTGDSGTAMEKQYAQQAGKIDVLKVGHHGSRTSTGGELLDIAMPNYAVISCGADNTYGHPNGEVVDRLTNAGSEIFRTDERGTVVFAVSEGKLIYGTTK